MNRYYKKFMLLIKILYAPVRLINRNYYQRVYKRWMRKMGINVSLKAGYISPDVYFDEENYSLITIEEGVVISRNVTFLVHDYSLDHKTYRDGTDAIFGSIHLKANSFIGANSTLMFGTTIGENSIVGTGSVVKGNVPDNCVVCGNPAKVICSISEYINKHSNYNQNKNN